MGGGHRRTLLKYGILNSFDFIFVFLAEHFVSAVSCLPEDVVVKTAQAFAKHISIPLPINQAVPKSIVNRRHRRYTFIHPVLRGGLMLLHLITINIINCN